MLHKYNSMLFSATVMQCFAYLECIGTTLWITGCLTHNNTGDRLVQQYSQSYTASQLQLESCPPTIHNLPPSQLLISHAVCLKYITPSHSNTAHLPNITCSSSSYMLNDQHLACTRSRLLTVYCSTTRNQTESQSQWSAAYKSRSTLECLSTVVYCVY